MYKKIENIKLPDTNVYFEKSSADGYAYLGYAYHKLGLSTTAMLDEVVSRNKTLNEPIKILNTQCTKENIYIYTGWACYEFLKEINNSEAVLSIINNLKTIGKYQNGYQRYCSEEINYIVPNVSSAAAVIYAENNFIKEAKELFTMLKDNQKNGNWEYFKIVNGEYITSRYEDNFHLGLMLYHFNVLKKYFYDVNLIKNSLKTFLLTDNDWLQDGSIGWGVPVGYLIYKIYGVEISNIIGEEKYNNRLSLIYKKTLSYLNHKNFRVRAMSAWVITKIIKEQYEK